MINQDEFQIRRDMQYLAGNLPHRGAYTENEQSAAQYLRERFLEHTPDVEIDPFTSFESWSYPLFASYYAEFLFVALVAIWAPAIAFVYGVFVFFAYLAEFTTYRVASRLLPQYESQNVVARFMGARPLRLFIVAAHYDSPKEGLLSSLRIQRRLRSLHLLLVLCMMTVLVTCAVEWFRLGRDEVLGAVISVRWAAVASLAGAAALLFLHEAGGEFTSGAVDNASGVACLLSLAARIRRSPLLDTSEVWLVATGAKDAWMSGMYHFVKTHDLDPENTYVLHLDRVGAGELAYVTGEGLLHFYGSDREMIEAAERVAGEFDAVPVVRRGMPSDALVSLARGYKTLRITGVEAPAEDGRLPEAPDGLARVHYDAIGRAGAFAEATLRQLCAALARHETQPAAVTRT